MTVLRSGLRSGGRAILVSVFSTTMISAGAPVLAQADPIRDCRENTGGEQERIACLEAAIVELIGAAPQATAQTPNRAEAETLAEAAPAETAQPPVVAEAAPEEGPTGLGAEQVLARAPDAARADTRKENETLTATVSDVAVTQNGAYVFFLDNGHIWRQKSSDSNKTRLSKRRQYSAEISKGAISGYRLRLSGVRRPFLVERIK